MKKYFIVASALTLITLCAGAQTTRQHIEKALTDPRSAENAARADAMLIDNKRLMDSSQVEARPSPLINQMPKNPGKKRKGIEHFTK